MTTPDPATCGHYLVIEGLSKPEPPTMRRWMHTACTSCGAKFDIVTNRSNVDIITELIEQGRPVPDWLKP